jgi:acetylornithine deacetylase/succinyl-diaminopimelate desuccinylase-like protein
MTSHRSKALAYAAQNLERFLSDLEFFSSIASVSTDPNANTEMSRAAAFIADHLNKIGMHQVKIMPTKGHPVVYAENQEAGPSAPTILIYGHYDVQPAEPLDLWESDAFKPEVRGEFIFGRGVTDMKGQVLASANAVESIIHTDELPINIKFLIEGEEEIGSPSLYEFLLNHKDLLKCDFALNPDTGMLSPEHPTITYALRGLAYFEIRIYGPKQDLHSGVFGGVVHNPAQALCELIAGMHDSKGRITLPGFYDRVRTLSAEERSEFSRLPRDNAYYIEQTGVPALWGEPEYSPFERTTARPTLEVHGLLSGFTGEGSKTVLPAYAMAKISMRLVPDQDPHEVHEQLLEYLKNHAPKSIRYEVIDLAGSPGAITDRNSNEVNALAKAMETVWGRPPIFNREGGSVPVVTLFQKILLVDTVNTGFSLASDNMHGPNERLHLPTWQKGTQALIHFLYNLGDK